MTMEDYGQYVPKVHFELIPIKNLVSNQDYQRNLSQKHIHRAAANFDIHQVNPVKVSRRNGVNYVFNGQHTVELVALVSGSRDTPVWCMIYDDLNYETEADIFANQMKYVKPLSPYEVFVANLEAGSDDQLMIRDLVESYGLHISSMRAPGNIVAVSTLESIFKKFGYHVLSRVLRLCIGAWEGDISSFSANIMNAVAKLVVVYGDTLKDDVFKDKVGAVSIKALTRQARERRPGSLGFAEAIILEYNGRKKGSANRLQMDKLYARERTMYTDMYDDEDEETKEESAGFGFSDGSAGEKPDDQYHMESFEESSAYMSESSYP